MLGNCVYLKTLQNFDAFAYNTSFHTVNSAVATFDSKTRFYHFPFSIASRAVLSKLLAKFVILNATFSW